MFPIHILLTDKSLDLESRLRLVMSKDPTELNILGKNGVSEETTKLFWKFFVLKKYGGILTDRNILLKGSINNLR